MGRSMTALLGLLACGPAVEPPEQSASGSDMTSAASSGSPGVTATTTSAATSVGTDASASTSGADGTSSDHTPGCGGVGIQCPDTAALQACDVWAQTCPGDDKCMPRATADSAVWNATRCSPVSGTPSQVGDACVVEGSAVSGIDSCDVSLVCLFVDPETNVGTCVANCTGSEADPDCDDPDDVCTIVFDGVIISCLPRCDPLLQDCPQNGACYPYEDGFICGDTIDPVLQIGEVCEYPWDCIAGSFCVSAELLPICPAPGCCTRYCDVSDAQSCGPNQICMPLFRGASVGYCA